MKDSPKTINSNKGITSFRYQLARAFCSRLPPFVSQTIRDWIYPFPLACQERLDFDIRCPTGSIFHGKMNELLGYHMGIHGYFDWRNLALALACCSKGDSIIEVGANIGTETIGFSDIVGPNGKIFAFEPFPDNLSLLERNSNEFENYGNVIIFPYAVGAACEEVSFSVPNSENSGLGFIQQKSARKQSKIKVSCVTLDSLSQELAPGKMIFIDVEGAEPLVLVGAKKFIESYRPYIVLEVFYRHLKRYGFTVEDLRTTLEGQNYTLYEIGRFRLKKVSDDPRQKSNWFCIPSEKLSRKRLRATAVIWATGILPFILYVNPLLYSRLRWNLFCKSNP